MRPCDGAAEPADEDAAATTLLDVLKPPSPADAEISAAAVAVTECAPSPPGCGSDEGTTAAAAGGKAVQHALKVAVASAAKRALQPRYVAGHLSREQFKDVVAATVSKVTKSVRSDQACSCACHTRISPVLTRFRPCAVAPQLAREGVVAQFATPAEATAWVAAPTRTASIVAWATDRVARLANAVQQQPPPQPGAA